MAYHRFHLANDIIEMVVDDLDREFPGRPTLMWPDWEMSKAIRDAMKDVVHWNARPDVGLHSFGQIMLNRIRSALLLDGWE